MRKYRIVEETRESGEVFYLAQRRCRVLPLWKSYYAGDHYFESYYWSFWERTHFLDIDGARHVIKEEIDHNNVVSSKVVEEI